MRTPALVLFILMYVLIVAMPKRRVWTACGCAVLFLVLGILPLGQLPSAINWNVLMMISGTMLIVDYFIDSLMPNKIAEFLLDHSKNVMMVTIYMSLFAGVISAFIDNVATVLMVAPVGLAICKKLGISPIPMILSIAVSSNLQGAATLVGDTTSILLGDYAGMDFTSFFWMKGRPGMFFATELGAVATVPIMMILFRKDREPVSNEEHTAVRDMMPTVMLLAMVALLIGASFIEDKPDVTNGLICLVLALLTMAIDYLRKKDSASFLRAFKSVDVETLLLLTALFVVIGGVTAVGIIDEFASLIVSVGGNNIFLLYTIIVWGSVAISAFVDNIPYVATMLPVLSGVTRQLGIEPYLLYFGLLIGATLGGNLTPIGASANITAMGMLRKEGHDAGFKDFFRIGIPFTLTAVAAGYLFVWIFWR
ncbi:MAG: TRAP transporter large permease subunit [Lachnospiraceae bacterium]|nr:TRAP transporter large permease subunit [Lachnospiraceae bacterium]